MDLPLSRRDLGLALVVATCWGVNFLAIHASLTHYPPFLLVALRFTLMAVPALLLIPRPQVPWRYLIGYGVGFGVLQFGFLYLGMELGMPVGLASLVLQSSAPFTVVLAALLLAEKPSRAALTGVAAAFVGLATIAVYRGLNAALIPVLCTLLAGLGWALGNLCTRQARTAHPLRLVWWMSVVPPLPMFAASWVLEGPERIGQALATAPQAYAANVGLVYTVLIGTLLGSGLWATLMQRNPSSTVAPFSMLVPVVGIGTAWLALGETPSRWELLGGLLVVGGVLWPHLVRGRRLNRRDRRSGPPDQEPADPDPDGPEHRVEVSPARPASP